MKLKFENKRISGILTVLPKREVTFEEEMENYNFSTAKSMKLKLAMGYNKHAVAEEGTCVSDMAIFGLNYLLDNGLLRKEDIDALILVTQSPEHFMPPTSNIIQGKLELKQDMICLDINQGCSGFVIGLMQSFMLLEQQSINKVVLINSDILSPKVSKQDRNSNPLIGDATCITIVERSKEPNVIHGVLKMDGRGAFALQIPAGGFRMPCTSYTSEMKEDANGNFRSLEHLVMRGDEVFNFVQTEVPPLIEEVLKDAGKQTQDIDYYMFHQPNKFMLNKLADKIGIPHEKMPANIVENFGNASGATIPTNISHNLGDRLEKESMLLCIAGFGVGLTWASFILDVGHLSFNKIIKF